MSVEIVMPRAGLTMVEGTITGWKVAEGAHVNKGDAIMEFENEKNVIDCEALDSGIIHILAQEGDTVAVGGVIGLMAADQAEYEALVKGGAPAAPAAAAEAAPAATPAAPAAAQAPFPFWAKKSARQNAGRKIFYFARLRPVFFCSTSLSAIRAMNSELVGLPLAEFTV